MGDTQENSKNSLEWPKPPLEILFELKTKEKMLGRGSYGRLPGKAEQTTVKFVLQGL